MFKFKCTFKYTLARWIGATATVLFKLPQGPLAEEEEVDGGANGSAEAEGIEPQDVPEPHLGGGRAMAALQRF